MDEPLLQVDDIEKSFGAQNVLNGVSFSMRKGEVKVIVGPSGTGKSTVLRCINMLAPPDKGRVLLEGMDVMQSKKNIAEARRRIGMVFQHFALFNHLTALNNVMLGLVKVKKMPKKAAADKACRELDRVGLLAHRDKYPAELSGGQKQRVGIARALAMDPVLMLFDEPTSALDPELIGEVLAVMQALARDGMTMICVTHEMGFARSVAHEILFMDQGRIIEHGPPEQIYTAARHPRTREFLFKINELYGGNHP